MRLVLFDIDGTLIRTGGAGVRAFERTGELEFQVSNGTSSMQFAGRTDMSLVREFFRRHGIAETPAHFERFFDRYVFLLDHFLSVCQGRLCPGVPEFLSALQQRPEPPLLGLLTGNTRLGAEIKLRHYGLWDRFVVGAFGDDHEDRNRLAEIARERGCRVRGRSLAPEEILVVGDTPRDVACGRAIGARVLAVATGGATAAALHESGPDWVVEDLRSVPSGLICV